MSLYRNEAPEACYGCKALAIRIEAVERERDALRKDVERLERAAQVSLERDEAARQALRAERDEALRLAAFRGMCHANACVERDAARQVLVYMRDADDKMTLWQWKPLIEKTLNPGE